MTVFLIIFCVVALVAAVVCAVLAIVLSRRSVAAPEDRAAQLRARSEIQEQIERGRSQVRNLHQ